MTYYDGRYQVNIDEFKADFELIYNIYKLLAKFLSR